LTATLDLWPIGNCQASALIDRHGRFVWGCTPRIDGEPTFSSLLDDNPPSGEGARGFWEINLENKVTTTQSYLRNTPILVTRHEDADGSAIEVIDFCPRFQRVGRIYRPVAFIRIVRMRPGHVDQTISVMYFPIWYCA
jgi:GH15 family glucan-1,4-alpha-glucosidase